MSNWKRSEFKIEMEVTIPANSSSTFFVPKGYGLKNITGINGESIAITNGSNEIELVAGSYKLTLIEIE